MPLRLVLSDGKAKTEIVFGRREQLILAVVLDNLLVFIVVKPIALAIRYGMHSLGLELLVVDGLIDDDGGGEFDADETAATRRVGEDVGHVGGLLIRIANCP